LRYHQNAAANPEGLVGGPRAAGKTGRRPEATALLSHARGTGAPLEDLGRRTRPAGEGGTQTTTTQEKCEKYVLFLYS